METKIKDNVSKYLYKLVDGKSELKGGYVLKI